MSSRSTRRNARVIVGPREALEHARLRLRDVNWIGAGELADLPAGGLPIGARVRSTRPPAPARLLPGAQIEFDEPEVGVSPGQACVFYEFLRPARARARRRLHRRRRAHEGRRHGRVRRRRAQPQTPKAAGSRARPDYRRSLRARTRRAHRGAEGARSNGSSARSRRAKRPRTPPPPSSNRERSCRISGRFAASGAHSGRRGARGNCSLMIIDYEGSRAVSSLSPGFFPHLFDASQPTDLLAAFGRLFFAFSARPA